MLQSSAIQTAILEDAVLDALVTKAISEDVRSETDLHTMVQTNFWLWIQKTAAAITRNPVDTLYNKLRIRLLSGQITERLSKSFSTMTLSTKRDLKKVLVVTTEGPDKVLSVRVPNIPEADTGGIDNLGYLLHFASHMLGISKDHVRVVPEPSLGNSLPLPSTLNKSLAGILAATQTTHGAFAGDVYTFETGFKANLVEVLGAVWILRHNSGKFRNKPSYRKKDGKSLIPKLVTLEILKDKFNEQLGLKAPGLHPFLRTFLLNVLAEVVKERNSAFPTCFIDACKRRNNVQNSEGVLAHLGYVPCTPTSYKILNVLLSKVEEENNKCTKISSMNFDANQGTVDQLDYREFRAAACMLLPLIDPMDSKPMKSQIAVSPLAVTSKITLEIYNEDPHRAATDALNLAYAVKQSVLAKNKNASPAQYKTVRDSLVCKFNTPVLKDRRGAIYPTFKEVPKHIRDFLSNLLHKKIEGNKRTLQDMEVQLESEVVLEGVPPNDEVMLPALPSKIQKT